MTKLTNAAGIKYLYVFVCLQYSTQEKYHLYLLSQFCKVMEIMSSYELDVLVSIAARAISCCDRDIESLSPCRRLIDWVIRKRKCPSQLLGKDNQPRIFSLFQALCVLLK